MSSIHAQGSAHDTFITCSAGVRCLIHPYRRQGHAKRIPAQTVCPLCSRQDSLNACGDMFTGLRVVVLAFALVFPLVATILPVDSGLGRSSSSRILDGLMNRPLDSAWMHNAPVLPSSFNITEADFVAELKVALDARMLTGRPVEQIFSDLRDIPHPHCHGTWAEFGVFSGATINYAAQWRSSRCGQRCEKVYGFDTFTGLPEKWRHMEARHFDLNGTFPPVRSNVQLIKGLFNETLPLFVKQVLERPGHMGVTYLHIDCDLYAGSSQVLTALGPFMHPGCILLFDELVNYPLYTEHEVKALWEWLTKYHRRVAVIGIAVSEGAQVGMYHDGVAVLGENASQQSVGFVVVK